VGTQEKLFVRWCNIRLASRNIKVENLLSGSLEDGVILSYLCEAVTGKTLPHKINTKATSRIHKIANCVVVLDFMKKEGLNLVGVGPEDIVDGNNKLIRLILETYSKIPNLCPTSLLKEKTC